METEARLLREFEETCQRQEQLDNTITEGNLKIETSHMIFA